MRSSRPLLLLALLLAGCDQKTIQKQVNDMRHFSDKEDRMYAAQALKQIQHTYWTLRDHAWMGKLPDGTIVRLDAPHATAAPLPSRAFYSGWHLQLTIASDDWRTYPPTSHDQPFQAVYAITRHSPTNWEIDVSDGPVTSPLHREDVALLQDDN